MPIRLPFESLIVPVRQVRARLSRIDARPPCRGHRFSAPETLGRGLGGAAPRRGAARALRPQGPQGRRLLSAARRCRRRDAAHRGVPRRASEHLRTAAIGREARAQRPGVGARDAADLGAELRASRRSGRRCTRPSQPSKRQRSALPRSRANRSRAPALARIDLALARKLSGLDATLATSGGNNLARWLTALPPNTLNAAAYRRLLQELARRLKLSYRFYGEPELKRLGAGAFLAVSQGNGTRDAGIVRLAYRPRGAASPGGEPRRERDLLRYRRHQPQGAQRHAGHAHRHGGKRGGRGKPVRPARGGLAGKPSIAGWRSPKIGSGRWRTSLRTWSARRTARPSR